MSLKSAVFNIHTQLTSEFNIRIPRSHVYELLAASCGCKTYASLCSSGFVVAQAQIDIDRNSVLQRCREIDSGHEAQIILFISNYLYRNKISIVSIPYIQDVICTPYKVDIVSFDTNGIDNGRWQYQAGLGYDLNLDNKNNMNFSYKYQGEGSKYNNNVVSLDYIYKF